MLPFCLKFFFPNYFSNYIPAWMEFKPQNDMLEFILCYSFTAMSR